MMKFVYIAIAALVLAAVNPALAQVSGIPDITPTPFPGPQPPAASPTPGATWRDQTGSSDWRNNTWRQQQFNENPRNDNWRQQRANEDWQEREKFQQRRNDYNIGIAPKTNENNAANGGLPARSTGRAVVLPRTPLQFAGHDKRVDRQCSGGDKRRTD